MHRTCFKFIYLLTLSLFIASAASSNEQTHWAPKFTPKFEHASYQTFHSATVDTKVGYGVYLPPSYYTEPERRYPVVYFLHGFRRPSVKQGIVLTDLYLPLYHDAITAGRFPEAIVIMCNGMRSAWYMDGENGDRPVESVIIKDLLPYVDNTYRTIATREGRTIHGSSMGGFGARRLGLKYADMFSSIATFGSGHIDHNGWYNALFDVVDDLSVPKLAENTLSRSLRDRGSEAYRKQQSPLTLLQAKHATIKDNMRIRLTVGDRDTRNLHGATAWVTHLQQLGIDAKLEVVPGVGHNGKQTLIQYLSHTVPYSVECGFGLCPEQPQ